MLSMASPFGFMGSGENHLPKIGVTKHLAQPINKKLLVIWSRSDSWSDSTRYRNIVDQLGRVSQLITCHLESHRVPGANSFHSSIGSPSDSVRCRLSVPVSFSTVDTQPTFPGAHGASVEFSALLQFFSFRIRARELYDSVPLPRKPDLINGSRPRYFRSTTVEK